VSSTPQQRPAHADESIPTLLKDLSEQTQTLVRQELMLAKAEMTEKGKKAGLGAGLLSGAGLFGLFAFACFTTMAIALLQTALDHTWAAAAIVMAVYAVIAAVLALKGKGEIQQATPVAPQQTIETLKEDAQWARNPT
jgi:uncharacterized membrane protein YqjE